MRVPAKPATNYANTTQFVFHRKDAKIAKKNQGILAAFAVSRYKFVPFVAKNASGQPHA